MHRIGLVLSPGASSMGLAPLAAFEMANALLGKPHYEIRILSAEGGPVPTVSGFAVATQPFGRYRPDTLLIAGSLTPASLAADRAGARCADTRAATIRYVQRAAKVSRRVAAICIGAFTAAEAGLLDGRRATTHWAQAQALQARFPAVKVEPDRIFIEDDGIWSSAGMSAGIDLALALVERDLGAELARRVARSLVLYHRRAGGQSQFSGLLDLDAKSDRIQKALTFARAHLAQRLGVAELAAAANLSPRQFSRAFQAETGQSPAKAIENLRVEAARLMMEEGSHPIEVVARETGFADRNRMRRAFLRAFGQPPAAIRRMGRG